MHHNSREKLFSDRRLERAAHYVSDRWFPANPDLLTRIQNDLASGRYESNVGALFADVRQDFSLFLYCLRELTAMLRQAGAVVPVQPLDLFMEAGLESLKSILDADEQSISHHRLKAVTPLQQSRFEEALLSASTAQALADANNLDGNACFSAALLRQLGLTLIAWNYPSVYERAVKGLGATTNLDESISRILGYSPSMLAVRILESWGLHDETIASLDLDEEQWFDCETLVGATTAPTFAGICRVGEALARANHPEIYPTAEADWNLARQRITEQLGADGLRVIRLVFIENCAGYAGVLKSIFKGGILLDPDYRQFAHRHEALLSRNPFIAQCRPHIEKRLRTFYEELAHAAEISQKHIVALAQDIAPAAGFTGGRIYTIDPVLLKLMPQLAIGQPRTSTSEAIDPTALSEPVARAYESIAPVSTEHEVDGSRFVLIAGVLGYSQRVGVVCLEMPRQAFIQSSAAHLLHFKAVTQSFNECLKLG